MKKTTQSSKKTETTSTTVNPKAQEASAKSAMSKQDLATLTAECVGNLNAAAETEAFAWVALGQLVTTYVQTVKDEGFTGNPFKRLAEHEGSVHREGQLRNYHGCCRLYNILGGEGRAPKTSMTNYIAVMGSRLGVNEKERLLNEAVEQTLTVSELKERVRASGSPKKARMGRNADPEAAVWKLDQFTKSCQSLYELIAGIAAKTKTNPIPDAIADEVQASLLRVVQLAIEHKLLNEADIPLPEVSQQKGDGDLAVKAAA